MIWSPIAVADASDGFALAALVSPPTVQRNREKLLLGRYELADHMLAQGQSMMEHFGREDSEYVALLRANYQLAVCPPAAESRVGLGLTERSLV